MGERMVSIIKICSKCKNSFPLNDTYFVKDKHSNNKFTSACKKCRAKQYQNWVEKNRQKERNKNRRKRLKRIGFTPELFNSMLEYQNNLCAICYTNDPGPNGWQADHDHNTGKARGVLCLRCNIGLGFLEQKGLDWADRAKRYIQDKGWYERP